MITRTSAAWKTEVKMELLTGIKWPCAGGLRLHTQCMPALVEVAAAAMVILWAR